MACPQNRVKIPRLGAPLAWRAKVTDHCAVRRLSHSPAVQLNHGVDMTS